MSGQRIGPKCSDRAAANDFEPELACGEIELAGDDRTTFVSIGAFVREIE